MARNAPNAGEDLASGLTPLLDYRQQEFIWEYASINHLSKLHLYTSCEAVDNVCNWHETHSTHYTRYHAEPRTRATVPFLASYISSSLVYLLHFNAIVAPPSTRSESVVFSMSFFFAKANIININAESLRCNRGSSTD